MLAYKETPMEYAENMMTINTQEAMDVIKPFGRFRQEEFTADELKSIEYALEDALKAVRDLRSLRREV